MNETLIFVQKLTGWIFIFLILLFTKAGAQSYCDNAGFELTAPGAYTTATAVSGWTISSQTVTSCNTSTVWTPGSPEFSIVATPIQSFSTFATIGHSPFGGTRIARLNNSTPNSLSTKLSKTFNVPSNGGILKFAYAFALEDGGHYCCTQSNVYFRLLDSNGNPVPCHTHSLSASGAGCPNGASGYSVSASLSWANWTVKSIDLSSYAGTAVILEVAVTDCNCGLHYGTIFFDASCASTVTFNEINFCPSSNYATIAGPTGYSAYFWTGPTSFWTSPDLVAARTVHIGNPIPGNVYTLTAQHPKGCLSVFTYTLAHSSVSITNIIETPSCPTGSTGAVSILPTGSNSGYNFIWNNNLGQTVGTNSLISNMPPGQYTVTVTAYNQISCGTASSSVQIQTITPVNNIAHKYCSGQEARLDVNTSTNVQWYVAGAAVSASLGGNSTTYTITNPETNSLVVVTHSDSVTGCVDSTIIDLVSTPPGSLSVPPGSVSIFCVGSTASLAILMQPSLNNQTASSWYSVTSTGSINPPFTASLSPTSSTLFTLSAVPAGTYIAKAYDGLCYYEEEFELKPFEVKAILSIPTTSICTGDSKFLSVYPLYQGIYSYSWSPTIWITNPNPNTNLFTFSPTTSPGTTAATVFSVEVKLKDVHCKNVYTIEITTANPITPTILSIPDQCHNSGPYTIQALPPGGLFSGGYPQGAIDPLTGVITPSLHTPWPTHYVNYVYSQFFCQKQVYRTYTILPAPSLSVNGNSNLCLGETTTLSAVSSGSVVWSVPQLSNSIVVSPSVSSSYSAIATHTQNNCENRSIHTVTVTAFPSLTLPTDTFRCLPASELQLITSGADAYLWNTGNTDPVLVVSPVIPTSYWVIATNYPGICITTASINVSVYYSPEFSIANNIQICAGETVTLTANGAAGYNWNGSPGSNSYVVKPSFNSVYQVEALDESGNCGVKKNVTVLVDKCVSLTEKDRENTLRVFPNPFQNTIHISLPEKVLIRLINSLGAIVYSQIHQKGDVMINTNHLPAGMYLLEGKLSNRTELIKLIKN